MARLVKSRRRAVMKLLPPVKCSGHTSAGDPCDQWSVVGATVCPTHGGRAPQVAAKAEERVTLAEAIAKSDPRHPWEVLEHTAHIADVLMRQVLVELDGKGTVSPALLERLIQALERANRLAKTTLDAGIDQRRLHLAEAQAGQIHKMLSQILDGLGLTPEQRALVPGLVRRIVEGELRSKAIEAA